MTSGRCRWMETESPSRSFRQISTNSDGQFSPDGKWIAYQSNESGRVEIYVQPFPGPGEQWPVSTNGGSSGALAARRQGIVLRRAGWPAHGGSHSESRRTPKPPKSARRSRCSLPARRRGAARRLPSPIHGVCRRPAVSGRGRHGRSQLAHHGHTELEAPPIATLLTLTVAIKILRDTDRARQAI